MKTKRSLQKTTPGKTRKIILVKQKPKRVHCANCGKALHGIKAGKDASKRNLSRSAKTVNRKYGGMYCSACSREAIIEQARGTKQ